MATIIQNYNQQFSGYELTTSYTVATKKLLAITRTISNRRWHPTKAEEFLTNFSPTAWKNLRREERAQPKGMPSMQD